MDRQSDQLQTTLANHLDFNLKLAVKNYSIALVALEDELRTHHAVIIGKRAAETRRIYQLQLTF
jgi:hypothetical protein